jgi:hypothetical protein
MVLLVAGTIAQKYIGLYQAQKLFFSSYVIWLGGFVPAPGGYTTLGLVFVNLLAKLMTKPWTRAKTGTLLTHIGALILLLGGFFTASFSHEGSLVISANETVNFVEDYRRNELAVTDIATGKAIIFTNDLLTPHAELKETNLPFRITIDEICAHCVIEQRKETITDGSKHGMLAANSMHDSPLDPDESQNIPGIAFTIASNDSRSNGQYGLFVDMPITQHVHIGGKDYIITLRRERTNLPFDIKLVKFDKQIYPGTDKPRAFSSEVIVQDGALDWHSLISMNNPLRYKGYTFYQSSFIENEQGTVSVLAVVKNSGSVFPYIASIILCFGILMHLFMRLPKLNMRSIKF